MAAQMPEQEPQTPPHSELASFGEELRREREIRGISLKEISDATKISKRFLEAIERNDHRTLPAPVFTRGFVREYARYLGLNSDEMVNRYNFAAAGDDRIEKSIHLDRLTQPQAPVKPVKPMKPRGIPPAYARIDRNVVVTVLIVAALVAVAVWTIRNRREVSAHIDGIEAHETTAATPAPTTNTTATAPAAPAAVVAPQNPAAAATLKLVVELSADSWMQIEADGKTIYSDDMHRGDRRAFEAKDEFRITVGKPAAAAFTVNDVKVPALTNSDKKPRHLTFDRKWLQDHAGGTVTATQ